MDAKKNILKDSRSNISIPNMNIEEDKENNPQINIIEDQEEIKINNKKNLKKQPVANKDSKDEEEYKFMPKLSKNSLLIASGLGDPLERLTAKKKTNRKPRKNNRDELTFTPKINSKSTIIDNSRRDKSMNRFQELHEQVVN